MYVKSRTSTRIVRTSTTSVVPYSNIEAARQEPGDELLCWAAGLVEKHPKEVATDVKVMVSFKPDRNLGFIHPA
jgi:hypothetical protein